MSRIRYSMFPMNAAAPSPTRGIEYVDAGYRIVG
jgi:hypothetical protein